MACLCLPEVPWRRHFPVVPWQNELLMLRAGTPRQRWRDLHLIKGGRDACRLDRPHRRLLLVLKLLDLALDGLDSSRETFNEQELVAFEVLFGACVV